MRSVAAGHYTVGYDIDMARVDQLKRGQTVTPDVSEVQLMTALESDFYHPSNSRADMKDFDVAFIDVPTPLDLCCSPDHSYVEAASDLIAEFLRPSMLVVVESTNYPGSTEAVIRPRLEKCGLVAGWDFSLVYSPERLSPGVTSHVRERNRQPVECRPGCLQLCSCIQHTGYLAYSQETTET